MARLKQAPRKSLTTAYSLSPQPFASHTATDVEAEADADAATQQLHEENRASASRTPNPPPPSAVLGANLLNAARIDFRHSSPPRSAGGRSSDGKLPKVGLSTEPTRKNLARPRGDIWAHPAESPEKRVFRLPERVNLAPLKIVRKKRAQQVVQNGNTAKQQLSDNDNDDDDDDGSEHKHDHDLAESEPEQPALDESPLPSSPPQVALGSDSLGGRGTKGVQLIAHFPDASHVAQCTAVSYKNTQPAGPRHEQCHNAGTINTNHGLRCKRHAQKPGSVRCVYVSDHTGNAIQCRRPGLNGTSRCAIHKHKTQGPGPRPREPPRRARRASEESTHYDGAAHMSTKRKSQAQHSSNGRASKTAKGRKHPSPGRDHQDGVEEVARKNQQYAITESIEQAEPRYPTSASRRQVATEDVDGSSQSTLKRPKKSTGGPDAARTTQGKSNDVSKASQSREPEQDEDEVASSIHQNEEVGEEEARTAKHPPGTIEHVLDFLDLDERVGCCQTKLGININLVCEKVSSHLQDNEITVEEVAEDIEEIREVVQDVGKVGQHLRAVKEDIYGYVFRSLALVLQSLYKCLNDLIDDTMHSLDAMRIILPFMRDILALKQTVSGWDAKVPQRYQGDRIIRDVDSYLIAPLRETERILSKRLSQYEKRESSRRQIEKRRLELEKEEEEHVRQTDAETVRRERWKRWQELHITRMQCEPDPRKRRHLNITKFEDLEERDANGQHFERVNLFRNRSTPPLRWASQMAQEVDWSDDQTIALLQGLELLAGPKVFHKIFRAHCHIDGILRDFNVAQIVAKATWICDNMKKLQQERGEEVPAWINQMPSLP